MLDFALAPVIDSGSMHIDPKKGYAGVANICKRVIRHTKNGRASFDVLVDKVGKVRTDSKNVPSLVAKTLKRYPDTFVQVHRALYALQRPKGQEQIIPFNPASLPKVDDIMAETLMKHGGNAAYVDVVKEVATRRDDLKCPAGRVNNILSVNKDQFIRKGQEILFTKAWLRKHPIQLTPHVPQS